MRIIFSVIGLLILGNMILFMLPEDSKKINRGFAAKVEVSPGKIVLLQSVDTSNQMDATSSSFDESDPSVVAVNIDGKCYRIGPFLHASRLSLAKTQLNNINVSYTIDKRESAAAEVFRVYTGPYADNDLAKEGRNLLNENDIFDHFQRKETDGSYIISLGIYSRDVSAQASKKKLEGKGFNIKVRLENTVLPDSYWLNLLTKESQALPHETLKKIDWGEYSAQFGAYNCQTKQ